MSQPPWEPITNVPNRKRVNLILEKVILYFSILNIFMSHMSQYLELICLTISSSIFYTFVFLVIKTKTDLTLTIK